MQSKYLHPPQSSLSATALLSSRVLEEWRNVSIPTASAVVERGAAAAPLELIKVSSDWDGHYLPGLLLELPVLCTLWNSLPAQLFIPRTLCLRARLRASAPAAVLAGRQVYHPSTFQPVKPIFAFPPPGVHILSLLRSCNAGQKWLNYFTDCNLK